MNENYITNSIKYVGVNDKTLDLFESQYKIPNGVSYNSYVILDDKIAIMDTVDKRAVSEWLSNLESVLEGKQPDYLIISHLEPDHAANIQVLSDKYPNMKLVGNQKIFEMWEIKYEGKSKENFLDINLIGMKRNDNIKNI